MREKISVLNRYRPQEPQITDILNTLIKTIFCCKVIDPSVSMSSLKYMVRVGDEQVTFSEVNLGFLRRGFKSSKYGIVFSSPARSAQSYCCHLGRPRLRVRPRPRPRHSF